MAKKSKIAKNEQRKEIVARYAERRAELKAIINHPNTSDEDRLDTPSASSVCPVSACARWLTAVSFRASVSPAGKEWPT